MGCRRRGWGPEHGGQPITEAVASGGANWSTAATNPDAAGMVHWQSQARGAAHWERTAAGHDESMKAEALLMDLGRIWTTSMWPSRAPRKWPLRSPRLQHSQKLVEEIHTAAVCQTCMITGDSNISRRVRHLRELLAKG
jgi:hypothetical protein